MTEVLVSDDIAYDAESPEARRQAQEPETTAEVVTMLLTIVEASQTLEEIMTGWFTRESPKNIAEALAKLDAATATDDPQYPAITQLHIMAERYYDTHIAPDQDGFTELFSAARERFGAAPKIARFALADTPQPNIPSRLEIEVYSAFESSIS